MSSYVLHLSEGIQNDIFTDVPIFKEVYNLDPKLLEEKYEKIITKNRELSAKSKASAKRKIENSLDVLEHDSCTD
jgi:hypothetical protein